MSDFFQKPFRRDTTPNSPREIFARLAVVLLLGAGLGAPALAFLAFAGRDERLLRGAYACAALALLLALTRRRWRTAAGKAAPAAGAPPATAVDEGRRASDFAGAPQGLRSRPRLLLLDASLSGPGGNSSRLLTRLESLVTPHAVFTRAALAGPEAVDFARLEPALCAADGFVFATGTHWDSWSSPLQKFLEDATPAEASALWLGKPAAVLVTEHSTGGKGVLSRLQGVLVTLGCTLPPFSGLVLSQAVQLARRHAPAPETEDFWSPEDLAVVAQNLVAAARQPRPAWRAWPVDRAHFARPWLDARG